jgi:hypothetical protein
MKRSIPNYLIAGNGIKIEKPFHVLTTTTPTAVNINEIIYTNDIFVVVGLVEQFSLVQIVLNGQIQHLD